jgi:hypothetical protein
LRCGDRKSLVPLIVKQTRVSRILFKNEGHIFPLVGRKRFDDEVAARQSNVQQPFLQSKNLLLFFKNLIAA